MPSMTVAAEELRRLFDQGHEFTLHDIQTRMGYASDRHARRLLKVLEDAHVPVSHRMAGGRKLFFVPEEHRRCPVRGFEFDEEEMLAMAVAAEAAKAALGRTPLGPPLSRAFGKLLAGLESEAKTFEVDQQSRQWLFGATSASHFNPAVFKTLRQAMDECRSVRIDYHTASTGLFSKGRKIDPLTFAVRGNSWLLVAYCHQRRMLRDFALSGIEDAALCDPDREAAYFTLPSGWDPESYFSDRFSALGGSEVYVIRLLVEAECAPYFERKEYHRTQMIEERREDGRIVVSYEVEGLDEIRSFVQSWGKGITVLDPPELVNRIADDIRILADRYAPAPA